MNDFIRLKECIGKEFSYDMIEKCLIEDIDATTEIDVAGEYNGYRVYYDIPDTKIYNVLVGDNNVITSVELEEVAKMNDFERLKAYINKDFDIDELIDCLIDKDIHVEFEDIDDFIELEGFGNCTLYRLYYDLENADVYDIWVNRRNVIATITVND